MQVLLLRPVFAVFALLMIALAALTLPASALASDTPDKMTPLLLGVADAPVPVHGSDGRTHLVYELAITMPICQRHSTPGIA